MFPDKFEGEKLMASWNNRLLNRTLSSLKTRQRYQYQLYDYLRTIKNKPQYLNHELYESFDEKIDAILS